MPIHPKTGNFFTALMVGIAVLLVSPAPFAAIDAENVDHQREQFLQAKRALEKGQTTKYRKLANKLADYPLQSYLKFWELERSLHKEDGKQVEAFLRDNTDSPLAVRLRRSWLQELARRGEWQRYLDTYVPQKRVELQCHYHRAQLETGDQKAAWKGANALWLTGDSQHSACDPLFAAWKRNGGITRELRWQRIALAMEKGNSALVNYLAKPLDSHDQSWAKLWLDTYDHPEKLFDDSRLQQESAMARMIIISVLERLARRDHEKAIELWAQLEPTLPFTTEQRDTLHARIGLEFALDRDERALAWFDKVSPDGLDETSYTWAVRSALRNHDWVSGLRWLEQMPSELANQPAWLYWRGRHLEALGRSEEARPFYQMASRELDYYGFLAADRLDEPYRLDSRPISIDQATLARVSTLPGVRRAYELLQVGLVPDARREWRHLIKPLDRQSLFAASALARDWEWHDRALITLARADYYDDLEIRFPLVHTEKIFSEAENRDIDPAWVLAVARQESAFMADVRSSAGAMGLMQIMPKTGRMIARDLKTRLRSRYQLLSPETNIRFGTYYLRSVLDELDNNPVLATAAYNAGPHRVRRWYPESGSLAADIWVETVPFNETRTYLRRVFAYTVFYESRLGRQVTRLSDRMLPILSQQLVTANERLAAEAQGDS